MAGQEEGRGLHGKQERARMKRTLQVRKAERHPKREELLRRTQEIKALAQQERWTAV